MKVIQWRLPCKKISIHYLICFVAKDVVGVLCIVKIKRKFFENWKIFTQFDFDFGTVKNNQKVLFCSHPGIRFVNQFYRALSHKSWSLTVIFFPPFLLSPWKILFSRAYKACLHRGREGSCGRLEYQASPRQKFRMESHYNPYRGTGIIFTVCLWIHWCSVPHSTVGITAWGILAQNRVDQVPSGPHGATCWWCCHGDPWTGFHNSNFAATSPISTLSPLGDSRPYCK